MQAQNQMPQIVESITIETLLKNNIKKFEAVLPKHLTPQQLFRLTISEINKNPEIAKCTTASLINSLLQCAQVGLELGTGKAYLIPYNNSKNVGTKSNKQWKTVKECQFQIGYKGLIELALRSGKILKIYAQPVFENEHFVFRYGSDEKLEHEPVLTGDKGEFIGAYAIAKFANCASGEFQWDYMSKGEIDTVRLRKKAKDSTSKTPWDTDYFEMAKKTVAKRLCKYLPSNSELAQAIEIDDTAELDFKGQVYENEEDKKLETKTDKLKRSLETQKAQNLVDAGFNPLSEVERQEEALDISQHSEPEVLEAHNAETSESWVTDLNSSSTIGQLTTRYKKHEKEITDENLLMQLHDVYEQKKEQLLANQ